MISFRLIAAVAVGVVLSLGLCACSHQASPAISVKAAEPGPIKIAFITNNASDYWLIAQAGVNQATSELGTKYNVQFIMPSDARIDVQEKQVNDLLNSGVKAIAISPIAEEVQTPWLNDICKRAAVITQDSDAPLSNRLAYLGTDNHGAGLLVGQMIKQALPHGGKIMLFVGNSDAQNAHDRMMGIGEALVGTKIKILGVVTDGADRSLAEANAASAMQAHPDLAMEVGLWGYNGPAILSAVENANCVGKVKIVCFDQEKETLAGIVDGSIYATIVQQPYQFGYEGTKLLANLAAGNETGLPKSKVLYFSAEAVTQKNVNKYITDLNRETNETWGPGS
jgi:ribose transport system substrate-binding protein